MDVELDDAAKADERKMMDENIACEINIEFCVSLHFIVF